MFLDRIKSGGELGVEKGRVSFRGLTQANIDWLKNKAKQLNLKYNSFLDQILTELREEDEGRKGEANASAPRKRRTNNSGARKTTKLRAGH